MRKYSFCEVLFIITILCVFALLQPIDATTSTATKIDTTEHDGQLYYVNEIPYTLATLDGAKSGNIMTYKMKSVRGEMVDATALVWYPTAPMPTDGGYRVIVWNHGTVGNADSCAPSKGSQFVLNLRHVFSALLNKGYILISPDYEGLGTPGLHPYSNLQSGAFSGIYAIKAFKEKHGDIYHGTWGSLGQSQGGHASLAIAEIAPRMDPGYKVCVAAAAPSRTNYITNVMLKPGLAKMAAAEKAGLVPQNTTAGMYAEYLVFASYLSIQMTAVDPSYDWKTIFLKRSEKIAELAYGTNGDNGICYEAHRKAFVDDIYHWLQEDPSHTHANYPALIPDLSTHPKTIEHFAINEVGTKKIDVPVMVVQGTHDGMVPYQVATWMVGNMTAAGTNVEYVVVQNGTHATGIRERYPQYIAFIEKHLPPYPLKIATPDGDDADRNGPFFADAVVFTHNGDDDKEDEKKN